MPLNLKAPGMRTVPKDTREWDQFFRDKVKVTADSDSVGATELKTDAVEIAKIKDAAVTLAKIVELTANRMLGRITDTGVTQQLTAAQVVSLLQAVTWVFAASVKFDGNVGFHGKTPISQPNNITDAVTAHALNSTFSDTEVEAALNALGVKFNDLKNSVIEAHGLSA